MGDFRFGPGEDWMLLQVCEVGETPPNVDYDVWVTRDGTRVDIATMTNKHLRNCLRLQTRLGVPYHPGLLDEYADRFGVSYEDEENYDDR